MMPHAMLFKLLTLQGFYFICKYTPVCTTKAHKTCKQKGTAAFVESFFVFLLLYSTPCWSEEALRVFDYSERT